MNREEKAAYMKRWTAEHREHIRRWRREYRERNRAMIAAAQAAWRQTPAGREAARRNYEKTKAAHKRTAWMAVKKAIKSGRLIPQPCQVCGSLPVQAHHHKGYEGDARLDVLWLCIRHHEDAHHGEVAA